MEEKIGFWSRIKKFFSEINNVLSYEYSLTLSKIQKERFWMYLFLALSLFFVITQKQVHAIISIIVLIALKFKFDYQTGRVKAYVRDKQGIPSRGDLRRLKEEANNVQKQS